MLGGQWRRDRGRDLLGYDLMFECAEVALAVPGFGINVERHLSVVQDGPARFQRGAQGGCSLSI